MSTIPALLDLARKVRKERMAAMTDVFAAEGYGEEEAKKAARAALKVGVKKAEEHNGYICTLQQEVHRPLSAMLRERFAHSGGWQHHSGEYWLGMGEIVTAILQPSFDKLIKGYRKQRKQSAPALFPDEQLSVFSLVNEGRDGITFLVWNKQEEPECWRYSGTQEQRFANLSLFLDWFNEHER
ncbi:hypothetical protein KTO58_21875 [Chitinophaga pendula]|uniref:hypothetical protein n=1 Tax=Chitinophaga TaxID=79328 RepID=UPI0012FE17E5|nr:MULTISPECIES: hypothetical protein [Chitinophaga]UCJ06296.1 hypothetical protein KTO58_21875 [Chitinophaga pendula]